MSTITKEEEYEEYKRKQQLLEDKRKRKSDEYHASFRRWLAEMDRVRKCIRELKAQEHTEAELEALYEAFRVFQARFEAEQKKEKDWEKAKIDQLNKDFTEEERKMFEEYYELEEMFVMPHVLSFYGKDTSVVPGTYEKIIAYVKSMLLIPGSIDRCKEYLERKLRRPWHIEEHKAYKQFIDFFVSDIEGPKEKPFLSPEARKALDSKR